MSPIRFRIFQIVPFLAAISISHARPASPPPPDLIKTPVEDTSHTYHLGPTGARGWIHMVAFRATPDDIASYFERPA